MLVPYLLTASLAVLAASFFVWRSTSSRPSLVSGVFGCIALLASARMVAGGGQQPDMAVGLPLLAGMLYWGRAIGTWLRVRKDEILRQAAMVWTVLGALCVGGAAWVYLTLMHR